MDKKTMDAAANNLRVLIAAMVEKSKSGHPGGAMGAADFINTLYSQFMVYDPADAHWIARDRFFLDPGHMSPMIYSVLALTGRYTADDLQQLRQWGSVTPGHPELDVERGIENASGPLGQGHAMAVGCAIAERFLVARFGDVVAHKTYAFISDGGVQEEISQGAGRLAGHLGLSNLIMFYDSNKVQLSTHVADVTDEDTAAKYRAWGWKVLDVDGCDCEALAAALQIAHNEKERPTLIVGHTVMARGAVRADGSSLEGAVSTHGQPLSKAGADIDATIRGLGGNPADPFEIRQEVRELYAQRADQLRVIVKKRRADYKAWADANPDKARQLEAYIANEPASVDWASIQFKPNMATRNSSGIILGTLAKSVGNMIVSSADLANSDKTDGFLKASRALTRGDFGGAFLHAGVAELTMAAVAAGITLHGAMRAACATFFVFSDYTKPAMRLAALMELPVIYAYSHDAFRVGEDGPTHQPVEQEAQIRLLEQVDNFKGQMSTLVLRPADSAETVVAWSMALGNLHAPTVLILSRQDLKDLPGKDRRAEAWQARNGAYVVQADADPQIVVLANGSEVSLAIEAAEILRQQGVRLQIVSMPSIGLFMRQPQEYRDQVMPPSLPRYAVTAGAPATFYPVMQGASRWDVFGMTRFGASAPAKVLDQKFGFTPQALADRIAAFLTK